MFFVVGKLKCSFGHCKLDRVVRKDRRALWREPSARGLAAVRPLMARAGHTPAAKPTIGFSTVGT
jgi:hypothetical protein